MARQPIGYMLTWTTYGSWLQGDPRGYVKKGRLCDSNPALEQANRKLMKTPPAVLSQGQQQMVLSALHRKAEELEQALLAVVVEKHHVHLVAAGGDIAVPKAVQHYKNAARIMLRNDGFTGRLWTRGYSVRYAFDDEQLKNLAAYVNKHHNHGE